MLPLCLVTGFLGTGKTSLLKHIVSGRPGAKLVYLVNEFSPEDVDGAVLLDTQYPDVVRLPGGSIFCKCLVTQFISHLNAIPQRFPEAEGVIIEASGMANPKVIESMLEETGLDKGYSLDGIITVVERRSFTALRHTLPNILAQIDTADVIVVNKTDLSTPEQVAVLESELRALNPRAEIRRAVHGRVDLDLFGHTGRRGLHGVMDMCRDPHYSSDFIPIPGDADLAELRAGVLGHANAILRAKGFLRSAGKTWYLDYSTTGISLTESPLPTTATPGLAVVLRGDASAHARAWVGALKRGDAAAHKPVSTAATSARVAFIGGFLGAGKTTAIRALAALARTRGLRPGAITNDQAAELVDTDVLRRAGLPVREVAGACFCCNFHGFAEAVRGLIRDDGVNLVLAEPVGSCTDLIATVLRPMGTELGLPVEVAPVSVLLDPARLDDVRNAAAGPASWAMRFLLEHQLREADLAVLSKNDLHSGQVQQAAADELRDRAPQAAILSVSARTGAGMESWFDFLLSGRPMATPLLELDYDQYAQAEAEMGWLNARAVVRVATPQPGAALAVALAKALQAELARQGAVIGNLKLELIAADGTVRAGATSTTAEPDVEGQVAAAGRFELVLNLRATAGPEALSQTVAAALDQRLRTGGDTAVLTFLKTFRPAPPKPTFRSREAKP